ncbi:preprotein translocase SecA subunit [Amycolatopsis mediterranei S699]|uniref:Protein translocase subunit SecA n=4 Tax=Amycolatopsis mediterranei TaxID=33910 RepID=A0A0H3DHM4_AMYMU|nr:preprotein translocase subunit SecA [Amycolatopsis mediterranei]ADJ49692.1 preprotein translocase SecA subunit [Amycolatopsis mediterranei U32]AEK46676.1 preprotein translocase subunit SecA [Amycolatopsis mediterranei S699]AFO81402.1 preprotein translocase SecA subunit [Amycolatopsis mediterranei S699]AGT88530.1 preprotein translocase SecA subunit [Amycolatopsis mediterranei RB]KDO08059.1 preprotein translocase subunit SecA [Amycolatopsis mediterranei]
MVLNRLLRAGEGKMVKRLRNIADHINTLEDDVKDLTDAELRAKTEEFRKRNGDGESLDDLLPEAFAVVREAAKRVLGQRHFDVQLMGGAALHLGQVAEMKTGEGKTLTCVLPAYLNAIPGKGVHVVTTNDYLAKRDSEWMGRIHRFLGLEVGVILSEQQPDVRRAQYNADITYGTNNEFGFDYLRDNMAWSLDDCVQRGHNYAIVDEVDSILIDEARTPLIISGPADQSSRWYVEFARLVPLMNGIDTTTMGSRERVEKTNLINSKYHYEIDVRKRTVAVTEKGVRFVEDQLGIDNLYEAANTPLVGYLNNALKVQELFHRDKDYIVRNGEVMIVDEFTGRILHGRRYNEGMHQAIEAKEKVEIKAENQTLATITLQNYFRLYEKLAGMTGTAETEAAEFHQTYKLGVVPIPTNRPMIRVDQADLIYKTEQAKFEAVAEDIAERHEKGQPVLVGTTSVEKSEHLSKLLVKLSVPHEVLNAKHHDREALIVARAGQKGAVTVATNMAGRGTDIVLGGNPDLIADQVLRERGLDPVEHSEEYEAAWPEVLEQVKAESKAEGEEVREAGGLYVLGTERHESRRIDNQLRGRSGRQGDPGESRFYLSLGDELMRRFNATMVERVMTTMRLPDDVPIEHKMVSKAIKSAQTQVEQINMEQRKDVLKYDEVMNEQRKVIYAERHRVLAGENLRDQIEGMLVDVVNAYVDGATASGYAEDWDHEKLWTALKTLYPVSIEWDDLMEDGDLDENSLREALVQDARNAYDKREAEINALVGPEGMRTLEHQVMLTVLDRKWREHLYEMDYLKQGIGMRALAQRDPLIEYQREGFDMFRAMLDSLKEEAVGFLFNLQVERAEAPPAEEAAALPTGVPTGNGQTAASSEGRHARPAPPQPPTTDTESVPAALRGKGLGGGGQQPGMTLSGPGEDGEVESHAEGAAQAASGGAGGTRRDRRAAQRDAAKKGKKGPRR